MKPIKISVGNVTVKIYRKERRKGDAKYLQFDVADYTTGKRRFITFADEQAARAKANEIAVKLARQDSAVLSLTGEDRAAYVRATALLRPTGIPLELAVAQFVDAHAKLGGRTLAEAVADFTRRNPSVLPRKTVAEVTAELLAAKKVDGASEVYRHDLDTRLGRFARENQVQIASVNESQVNYWLRGLNLSPRSRNNFRRAIGTLFSFAESVGYISKGHLDMDRVALASEPHADIEIFTAKEITGLLATALRPSEAPRKGHYKRAATSDGIVPLLALGAFAGLRTAEIERQDWADVNLERGFIRVTAAKGNTAQKRLVPILPNLAAWLAPHRRENGPVWQFGRTEDCLASLARRAGVAWKHNALRHSFASYRTAMIQDPAKVAYEMGNSPKMVVKHYRELVTPEEAATWFAISPAPADNTIPLPSAVNA